MMDSYYAIVDNLGLIIFLSLCTGIVFLLLLVWGLIYMHDNK